MDDRSRAAPHRASPGRPPPLATPPAPSPRRTSAADPGGLFAVLEAAALAALGIDPTDQPAHDSMTLRDLVTAHEGTRRERF